MVVAPDATACVLSVLKLERRGACDDELRRLGVVLLKAWSVT